MCVHGRKYFDSTLYTPRREGDVVSVGDHGEMHIDCTESHSRNVCGEHADIRALHLGDEQVTDLAPVTPVFVTHVTRARTGHQRPDKGSTYFKAGSLPEAHILKVILITLMCSSARLLGVNIQLIL